MDRKEIKREIKKFKEKIDKKTRVEKLIIFGSFARGRMKKDSDIDLLIVGKNFRGKKFFERPVGLHKYWKLDYPVDFLCYTPEEFEKKSKQITIVRNAVKEGIVI